VHLCGSFAEGAMGQFFLGSMRELEVKGVIEVAVFDLLDRSVDPQATEAV
jgi:hypothetical protein